MNIVLTGFMGTGKTAVGRRLADELRAVFIDVDEMIEKRAGRSVREIFASEGEQAFRLLETEAIEEAASRDRAVISTGGGAILSSHNREILKRGGILVCLSAKTSTLLERLKDDMARPLLAGGDVQDRIDRLMKERQSLYDLCPVQVVTDDKTIADVTREIIAKVHSQWS